MNLACAQRNGLPPQLPPVLDGPDDPDRLATRRSRGLAARRSPAARPAGQGKRGLGLLHLHEFLERPGAFAPLVVHVWPAMDIGRLPDDADAVLDRLAERRGGAKPVRKQRELKQDRN